MVHSANKPPFANLSDLPEAKQYFIAYSGGKDSTALLHALSLKPKLKNRLKAIHVNHNINPESNKWAQHCKNICAQLKIPIITESVVPQASNEAALRQARNDAFKKHLKEGDCLMTAHHRNDQVETVLFRLFRGTGLQGMTGISKINQFHHYTIYRPLLHLSQNDIDDYINSQKLEHVEDASNYENHFSRNYIRNLVIPELEKYDKQTLQNIDSTAKNLYLSQQLLSRLVGNNNPFNYLIFKDKTELSTAFYHWLHNLNQQVPNRKRLDQFSHDCLQAAKDKTPLLLLNDYYLIRWNNHVYALRNRENLTSKEFNIKLTANQSNVILPNNGELFFNSTQEISFPAIIKYRQTHERIQIHATGQHKKLKNLFQQHKIPPWERDIIPYLYINNQLMAVGTQIFSADFLKLLSEYKAEYRWISAPYIL